MIEEEKNREIAEKYEQGQEIKKRLEAQEDDTVEKRLMMREARNKR